MKNETKTRITIFLGVITSLIAITQSQLLLAGLQSFMTINYMKTHKLQDKQLGENDEK